MKTPVLKALALLSLAGAMVSAAHAVVVDFSNPTDLADNFQVYNNSSSVSVAQGNNTFVTTTGATFNTSPKILIYDTTPLETTTYNTFALNIGQTLTVSVDVASITGANTSLGFYFLNPGQALTAFAHSTALLNFENSGTNELARFGTFQQITGVGTTSGTPATGDGGISLNDPTFRTVTATYTRTSAEFTTMTLNAGSFTSTFTAGFFASNFNNVGVAVRLFPATGDPANSFLIDNITIVPEPSTWALLGLGLGALLFFRRRKNVA